MGTLGLHLWSQTIHTLIEMLIQLRTRKHTLYNPSLLTTPQLDQTFDEALRRFLLCSAQSRAMLVEDREFGLHVRAAIEAILKGM